MVLYRLGKVVYHHGDLSVGKFYLQFEDWDSMENHNPEAVCHIELEGRSYERAFLEAEEVFRNLEKREVTTFLGKVKRFPSNPRLVQIMPEV